MIEIWPKEVEMIPRRKFQKDPQRGRERVVKGAMDLFGVRKTVFESWLHYLELSEYGQF